MTMKANELRIGNLVKDSREDYPCKVVAVYSERSFITKDDREYVGTVTYTKKAPFDSIRGRELMFLEPIPLTKELILKCGFSGDMDCGFGNDAGVSLHLSENISYGPDPDGQLYPTINCAEFSIGKVPVKYLHQLQNLNFALTGEELDVKL